MKYTKTVWKDLPDTSTPITADKLNNLENGVEYLFENGVGSGVNVNTVKTESDTDTYSCNYLNNAIKEVCSTEETVVGTYNGKTLYRKILGKLGKISLNEAKVFDISDLKIDEIVNYKGFIHYKDDPNIIYKTCLEMNTYYLFPSENAIVYDCDKIPIDDGEMTIEYTKTTDSASEEV